MSTNLIKKLPADYQEVLVANEMELEEKISVEVLRKLVYLYTRGMQYYDLTHKEKFRKFYSDKLVALLTRKDIIDFLDKNPINFEEKTDLDKLFPAEEEEIILPKDAKKRNSYINLLNNSKQFASQIRRNSIGLIKNKMSNNDISLLVKQKIMEVSVKLNKIDQAMTNEIVSQMTEFEDRKRNKKTKKDFVIDIDRKNSEEINIENKRKNSAQKSEKNSDQNSINSESNSDEENENNGNTMTENKEEMDKLMQQMNPGLKNLIGNNPMLREIEEFVQKNMDEMYKSFEELKASFQEEINEAEENGFPDIAEGLKEDLENELENLKDQYEEQRRVETEKIKKKYSNRNSLLVVS